MKGTRMSQGTAAASNESGMNKQKDARRRKNETNI